jgi:hypothetical protein
MRISKHSGCRVPHVSILRRGIPRSHKRAIPFARLGIVIPSGVEGPAVSPRRQRTPGAGCRVPHPFAHFSERVGKHNCPSPNAVIPSEAEESAVSFGHSVTQMRAAIRCPKPGAPSYASSLPKEPALSQRNAILSTQDLSSDLGRFSCQSLRIFAESRVVNS